VTVVVDGTDRDDDAALTPAERRAAVSSARGPRIRHDHRRDRGGDATKDRDAAHSPKACLYEMGVHNQAQFRCGPPADVASSEQYLGCGSRDTRPDRSLTYPLARRIHGAPALAPDLRVG